MNYVGPGEITAILTNGIDYIADTNAFTKKVKIEDAQDASHTVSLDTPVSVIEGETISVKLSVSPALMSGESMSVDLQVDDVEGTYLNYTSVPISITDANSSRVNCINPYA